MRKLSNGLADPEKALSAFMQQCNSALGATPLSDRFAKSTNSFVTYKQIFESHQTLEKELATCAKGCAMFKQALQSAMSVRDDLRDHLQREVDHCANCMGKGEFQNIDDITVTCRRCKQSREYLKEIA